MKFYKVYHHPNGHSEAVKQGWSWPAFFFGFIWALIKKLWLVAVILIAISMIMVFAESSLMPNPANFTSEQDYALAAQQAVEEHPFAYLLLSLAGFVTAVIMGAKGNKFRENKLLSSGYHMVTTTQAKNPNAALYTVANAKDNYS